MIIQCSKCKTSFNVDQNLISNEAKVYHCSVCKNEWSIEYDQSFDVTNGEKVKKDLNIYSTQIYNKKNPIKKKTVDNVLSEIDDLQDKDIDDVLEIPAFLRR